MFFVPHVMCQWPSAILVQKLGPRIFLPGAVLLWGIIMLCFGFVKNWKQLVALRVLVGIFEAGLLPGTILLLQMWYRRCRLSCSFFFCSRLRISTDTFQMTCISDMRLSI